MIASASSVFISQPPRGRPGLGPARIDQDLLYIPYCADVDLPRITRSSGVAIPRSGKLAQLFRRSPAARQPELVSGSMARCVSLTGWSPAVHFVPGTKPRRETRLAHCHVLPWHDRADERHARTPVHGRCDGRSTVTCGTVASGVAARPRHGCNRRRAPRRRCPGDAAGHEPAPHRDD